jgi:hypothetical protein
MPLMENIHTQFKPKGEYNKMIPSKHRVYACFFTMRGPDDGGPDDSGDTNDQ